MRLPTEFWDIEGTTPILTLSNSSFVRPARTNNCELSLKWHWGDNYQLCHWNEENAEWRACIYLQNYVLARVNRNDSLFRLHRPGCETRKNIETAAKNLEVLYHTHFERLDFQEKLEKVENLTWKSSKWWIVKKLNNQKLLENSMARNPTVVLLWFLWILFIS